MTKALVCAWLNRHEPTPAMQQALAAYHIVPAHPAGRCDGADGAWAYVQQVVAVRYHRRPDVVVVVLPRRWRDLFVRMVEHSTSGRVSVVKLVMEPNRADVWTGRFALLHWHERDQMVMRFAWTPEMPGGNENQNRVS